MILNGQNTNNNQLPIFNYKSQIIEALRSSRVVIIVGQTGCGKSTQVPQYLYEYIRTVKSKKRDMIACLHPRTIAAIKLSERVSWETNTVPGNLIGYRVRFYNCYNNKTRIVFMTSGFMTGLLHRHRTVGRYGIVIIDEAHERSIQNDIIMGQMKEVLKLEKDVKLVIMSATINVDEIVKFYPNSAIVRVSLVEDHIDVIYRCPKSKDYIMEIKTIVGEIIKMEKEGHILIFLPTELKVQRCQKALKECAVNLLVLKFYSSMDRAKKMKVFNFSSRRKIICATNVAETSLTIEGVNFVIDSGMVQRVVYNHGMKVENWITAQISKAEADQRKGRTGRIGHGTCYRLYNEIDIDPHNEILTALNQNAIFVNHTEEEKRQIIEKLENNFTIQQLKSICKLPIKIMKSKRDFFGSFKQLFEVTKNAELIWSVKLRKQLMKSLQRNEYFKSKNDIEKEELLNEIIARFSPAQLHFIAHGDKLPGRRIKTDDNFLQKIENYLFQEGKSENVYLTETFSRFALPEIRFANLGSMILKLKSLGFDDVMTFPFIVEPDLKNVNLSITHLKELSLLEDDGSLSDLGKEVANLPLSPPLGKVAVIGSTSPCRREILIIISLLSVRFIFRQGKHSYCSRENPDGYLFELLDVYEVAKRYGFDKTWCKHKGVIHSNLLYADLVVQQLDYLLPPLADYDSQYDSVFEIKTVFLCGFFHNLAFEVPEETKYVKRRTVRTYRLTDDRRCQIDHFETAEENCSIIMPTILKMSNFTSITMKHCTGFNKEMLEIIEPLYFNIPVNMWDSVLKTLHKS